MISSSLVPNFFRITGGVALIFVSVSFSSPCYAQAGGATGKQRAEKISNALQNPDPAVGETVNNVLLPRLESGGKNPYQGGVSDPKERQKLDAATLVGKGPKPKPAQKPALQQCMDPKPIGKCCKFALNGLFGINLPPRDLYGYHYPMLLAEVSENSYVSRILSKDQVNEGCQEILNERKQNGAQMANAALSRMQQANGQGAGGGAQVQQGELNDFLAKMKHPSFGYDCINELDSPTSGARAVHVIPAEILFTSEYQKELAEAVGVKEDTFSKMSRVWAGYDTYDFEIKGLRHFGPVGSDNMLGYQFSGNAYPEKVATLRNPRENAMGPVTDPAKTYQKAGGYYELVKRVMGTKPNRTDVTEFDQTTGTFQQEFPNDPAKMISSALIGTSLNYKPMPAAWTMILAAALNEKHKPQQRVYPVFEVMPYATKAGDKVGDKILVQGGPNQDYKCYGGKDPQSDPNSIFRYEEEFGEQQGSEVPLMELTDIDLDDDTSAEKFHRYVVFIYAQSCPALYTMDPSLDSQCQQAVAPDGKPPMEYYGSGGRYIPDL